MRKVPAAMLVRLGWTTGSFGIVQVLRLLNNVALARLLAPSLLGFMVIVNAVRTGVELLSDVGINQNIVSNKKGESPDFYDTAWTIQVLRGLLLGAICIFFANVFATFFEQPELATVLPVIALLFVFAGFNSKARALLQKRLIVRRASIFEVAVAVFSLVVHVALALITPTIWALVLGTVITGAAGMAASYLLLPKLRHRFVIHVPSAREILVFGKWIFASSIIFFLAMNFDRLYFAKQITLAELGVYGIARSLADILRNLAIRSSNLLLFPAVAAMQATAPEVRQRLLHGRRMMLFIVALTLAFFVAVSDELIRLLYDARYADGAMLLPVLLLGVWFAILGTVNDSILLGTAKPAYPALSNGAKLLTYVVGVPLAFYYHGFIAAVLVLNLGEIVRYVVLWMFSRRQHLGFGRDDLALTVLFVGAIFGFRALLWALGLTGDFDALFPMIQPEFWVR